MISTAEMVERMRLVSAGMSWVATPYRHHCRVKGPGVRGAGVDCAHFLTESHFESGLVQRFDVGRYNHDWHRHQDEERYLAKVEEYLKRVDDTEAPLLERDPDFFTYPGNVIVWKVGRTYSHGALVKQWPVVIHASFPARSVITEDIRKTIMEEKPMRVYSFWGR